MNFIYQQFHKNENTMTSLKNLSKNHFHDLFESSDHSNNASFSEVSIHATHIQNLKMIIYLEKLGVNYNLKYVSWKENSVYKQNKKLIDVLSRELTENAEMSLNQIYSKINQIHNFDMRINPRFLLRRVLSSSTQNSIKSDIIRYAKFTHKRYFEDGLMFGSDLNYLKEEYLTLNSNNSNKFPKFFLIAAIETILIFEYEFKQE